MALLPDRPFAGTRSVRRAGLTVAVWLTLAGAVRGEFPSPTLVSSGEGTAATEHALGTDFFDNVHVAFEDESGLRLLSRAGGEDRTTVLAARGRAPALSFSATELHVAYLVPGDSGPARIEIRVLRGVSISEPETVGIPHATPANLQMRLDPHREAVLAWDAEGAGADREVWVGGPSLPARSLGSGESPSLQIDSEGGIHVVYRREGDLWYVRSADAARPEVFQTPRRLTTDGACGPCAHDTALLEGTSLQVLYAQDGELLLGRVGASGVETRTVDHGEFGELSLDVSSRGLVSIVYLKEGDVWLARGNAILLLSPERVTRTEATEAAPAVAADSENHVLVTFAREGELYLTTDAGTPRARFEVSTDRGPAPLEVRFTDRSDGDPTRWFWDFGDGGTSTQRHPSHVFEESGEYAVRLEVWGPAGPSEMTHEHTVLVAAPGNRMWVTDVSVFPGLRSVPIPIYLAHEEPAQGFQVAARYDPSILSIREVDFEATNIGLTDAELLAYTISDDPDDPFVTVGVLLDIEPPFDRRVLSPGRARRIVNLVADISSSARMGSTSEVWLENGVGRPPLNNIITVRSHTVLPVLGPPGVVRIEQLTFPPPGFFVRGDVDDNGSISISDAISILRYLFLGGTPPRCHDAADTSDDGKIDISDAGQILNYLFQAGDYPLPPGPRPGLDPTLDDLPGCGL